MAGSNGDGAPSQPRGRRVTVPQRMLNLLSDGHPHSAQELHGCLEDELGPVENIKAHLTFLRKVLEPRGEDITCRVRGGIAWYAHVRSIRIN